VVSVNEMWKQLRVIFQDFEIQTHTNGIVYKMCKQKSCLLLTVNNLTIIMAINNILRQTVINIMYTLCIKYALDV